MASSNPPLYVFIIIIVVRFIITILTVHGGIPHMATNYDEYNGYYIPKGTIIFGSAWPV